MLLFRWTNFSLWALTEVLAARGAILWLYRYTVHHLYGEQRPKILMTQERSHISQLCNFSFKTWNKVKDRIRMCLCTDARSTAWRPWEVFEVILFSHPEKLLWSFYGLIHTNWVLQRTAHQSSHGTWSYVPIKCSHRQIPVCSLHLCM